jgi:hypothetical protein
MYDIAYLRKLAERYRKLARKFNHANIRERLEVLADVISRKGCATSSARLNIPRNSAG